MLSEDADDAVDVDDDDEDGSEEYATAVIQLHALSVTGVRVLHAKSGLLSTI